MSFSTFLVLLQCGLSHKLQHLFESAFPSETAPDDSDLLTLQALLEPQDHAEIRCHTHVQPKVTFIHSDGLQHS